MHFPSHYTENFKLSINLLIRDIARFLTCASLTETEASIWAICQRPKLPVTVFSSFLPRMKPTFPLTIMLTVTAGFRWAPPNSPKVHAMVLTMKPIARATWTTLPTSRGCGSSGTVLQCSGTALWTVISMNVPKNSASRSLQKPFCRGSSRDLFM